MLYFVCQNNMFKNAELRQVKVWKHFCKKCNRQIQGNGSDVLPYNCHCGIWKFNYKTNKYEVS